MHARDLCFFILLIPVVWFARLVRRIRVGGYCFRCRSLEVLCYLRNLVAEAVAGAVQDVEAEAVADVLPGVNTVVVLAIAIGPNRHLSVSSTLPCR